MLRKILPLAILCSWVAVGAQAEPARLASQAGAATDVHASFDAFAKDWMERARSRGERDRSQPRARPGADQLVFTYRAVAEDFETDLQATGRPGVPWVGVLRYTERTYVCDDVQGTTCHVASALPVVEVFRYRGGRWTY
jgi:hypothetical protein